MVSQDSTDKTSPKPIPGRTISRRSVITLDKSVGVIQLHSTPNILTLSVTGIYDAVIDMSAGGIKCRTHNRTLTEMSWRELFLLMGHEQR